MTIEHKTFKTEIKQVTEKGEFEAVIATLGVIDSDGDVILPGAFKSASVTILPAHDSRSTPLGKGQIEETGNEAILKGRFNLEIQAAKERHSSLKFDVDNPPALQEWSFGFETTSAEPGTFEGQEVRFLKEMNVFEASPVLRGAGVNTRTLAVKQKFSDQIDKAIAEFEDIIQRAGEVTEMRKQKGKDLSAERKAQIGVLVEKLGKLSELIQELQEPEDSNPKPEEQALIDYTASQSRRHLTNV